MLTLIHLIPLMMIEPEPCAPTTDCPTLVLLFRPRGRPFLDHSGRATSFVSVLCRCFLSTIDRTHPSSLLRGCAACATISRSQFVEGTTAPRRVLGL